MLVFNRFEYVLVLEMKFFMNISRDEFFYTVYVIYSILICISLICSLTSNIAKKLLLNICSKSVTDITRIDKVIQRYRNTLLPYFRFNKIKIFYKYPAQ